MNESLYAGVEAGGTKFVCGVGSAAGGSRETVRIATRAPDETLADVVAFFEAAAARHGPMKALGVASFGPLDLDPASPAYGAMTTTPKPGWSGAPILRRLSEDLRLPSAIDTDVNAAALAEAAFGAGRGAKSVAYVTVGTGIGVGFARNGKAGLHAEGGHVKPRRRPEHEGFAGVCPFHGDCLEGLASGPAIEAAWGRSLEGLAPDHPAFAVQADYLGQLCATIVLMAPVDRIVLGGGVMGADGLYPLIRRAAAAHLAGYVASLTDAAKFETLIVPPGCHEPPGLLGAYLLAAGT